MMDNDYVSLMLEVRPFVNALEEDEIENDSMRSLNFCKELEAVLGDECSLDFFYFDKSFFFPIHVPLHGTVYGGVDDKVAVFYVTKLSSSEVSFKHFQLGFTVKDFSDKKKLKEKIKQQLEKPKRDPTEFTAQEMVNILKLALNDTCFTFPDEQELQTMFMKIVKGCRGEESLSSKMARMLLL